MKKMAVVVLCVVMLSMAVAVNESAATTLNPDWFNVTVQNVGVLQTLGFLFATCAGAGGTQSWTDSRFFGYDSSTAAGKAMLAAALTGYASGGTLAVQFPGQQGTVGGPPAGSVPTAIAAGTVS